MAASIFLPDGAFTFSSDVYSNGHKRHFLRKVGGGESLVHFTTELIACNLRYNHSGL